MKNNKMKRLMALMLCVMLFGATFTTQAAFGNMDTSDEGDLDRYPIDESYEYPIVPGTDEWKALDNNIDKMRVCMIPEDVLNRMTTEALLETVLSYPLIANMLIWETTQQGYEVILRNFNGLQELVERDDLDSVLETYSAENISVYANMTEDRILISEMVLGVISFYNEHPITYLITMNPIITGTMAWTETATIYTPMGTPILVGYNGTFDSHHTSERAAESLNAEYQRTYPNAVQIAPIDAAFNCHAYAWYGNGSASRYWLNNVSPYINDRSYSQVGSPSVGDIALYICNEYTGENQYTHSAVLANSLNIYTSKWHYLGTFRHTIYDCPYYLEATSIEYWSR